MTSIRLPRTVVPRRYQIRIEPDLTAGTFVGDETIEVTVGEPTAEVVLNAADLTIATADIERWRGTAVDRDDPGGRGRGARPAALRRAAPAGAVASRPVVFPAS